MSDNLHEAEVMAHTIERWLGNPLTRNILKFCTKKCKCGKRVELVLKSYTGQKQQMCMSCEISSFLVKKVLDHFVKKGVIPKKLMIENLSQPMFRKGLTSVIEGIAKWGLQKPFTGNVPFLVVWNITRACNLNCKHCYEDAHTPQPDELIPAQRLEAIDKMADAGVAYIAISGGEPLVLPDLWDVAERIKQREMGFAIATNGTLLTNENVQRLKDVDCKFVQVSLDGADANTHDSFRGVNVFKRTIKGIKTVVASGISIGISCTVTRYNYHQVPAIIDLAEKLGVKTFLHYNFIPTGRGKQIIDKDITPQEREEMLKFMATQNKKRKIIQLSTAPQYSRVCMEFDQLMMTHFQPLTDKNFNTKVAFLAEFIGGCGAGRLYCGLEPNGDIKPCVFIPIKLGNIMTDNFLDIWHNDKTLNKIRARHEFKGNCQRCSYRNICGGCRARAYAYYGDIQASDPGCLKQNNKISWNGQTRELVRKKR